MDFNLVQIIISIASTVVIPALAFFVKSTVEKGQQKTNEELSRLRLEVMKNMGAYEGQHLESAQIHRDTNRRLEFLEQAYTNIGGQMTIFQGHFSKLLQRSDPRTQSGD